MRKSSLAGLQELVTHHPEDVLVLHLTGLIEGTARLILDQEKDVRKDALKLLNSILTQVIFLNSFNATNLYRYITFT
jgi:hypothetical protein